MTQFDENHPILVRGMSRSGGTLLCTLLDAHPDIAFSFELYPALLLLEGDVDQAQLANDLKKARNLKAAAALAPTKKFATFINRLPRGGLDGNDLGGVIEQAHEEGYTLTETRGAMRVMELCCHIKRDREGVARWGLKCNGGAQAYLDSFSGARFLDIVRDGRDVLASQKNTGSFKPDAASLAKSWVNTHSKFVTVSEKYPGQVHFVKYEDLTANLEEEMRKICTFLDLPFSDSLLNAHKMDLTVFKTQHLSRDRIMSKVDTSKIGRWKAELTPDEIDAFMSVAGEHMAYWGYEV